MRSPENSSVQNENESSEKGDTNINLFDDSFYQKEKEGSQKGSLKSYQNSKISKNKHDMSEENQNNNISSGSEDLINTDTVNEEKKNQEDPSYILYGDNYNILEEITFILIINNNKENKIKYEKVIYKGREITYKEFNDLSQEELKKNMN